VFKVCFIILKENRTLQLPGSTSTNPGISDLPVVPPVGMQITDVKTGVPYYVVKVQDVRQGTPGPSFLDYLAELEPRATVATPDEASKTTPEVAEAGTRSMQEKVVAYQQWTERYGHIRPHISADYQGHKFVAAGKRLMYSNTWKFVPDFLRDYIPTVFGKEWGDTEQAKPEAERHPVFQWRVEALRYMNTQSRKPDGSFEARPSGFLAAYMGFAFNLFAVEDNGGLDETLLRRLKHHEQFQGARHELFAEATCLRAGFRIEREDEKDPTKRHAEFTAVHITTGERFSVEAKSRHYAGVLGRPGSVQLPEKMSLTFGHLINDAIAKKPQYPLVIFVDTNLPFRTAQRLYAPQSVNPIVPPRYMLRLVERVRKDHSGVDPYAMLIFTNHPHHYSEPNELDPQRHVLAIISTTMGGTKLQALQALYWAVNLYGNIPNEFPPQ
jgi:hypothetical protein